MNQKTKEMKQKAKLEYWYGQIQDYQKSGKKVAEFCEERGLCQGTFYRYQKMLREQYIESLYKQDDLADKKAAASTTGAAAGSTTASQSKAAAPAALETAEIEEGRFAAIPITALAEPTEVLSPVTRPTDMEETWCEYPSASVQNPAMVIQARGFSISIANHADPNLAAAVMRALSC